MAKKTEALNTTDIDYEGIKANLIDFMRSQEEFTDYNFEGSGLNAIINLLSYVTHYNAVNANFAINETFLDSAQLRQSVVSHAKLLGYTPRSANAPSAFVNVQIVDPVNVIDVDGNYLTLIMERGTEFNTTVAGNTYTYVTIDEHATIADLEGNYKFNNIRIEQGSFKTTKYIFDQDTSEKFVLPYEGVVSDSLRVTVQQSLETAEYLTFTIADNIATLDETSEVYFLQESREGYYEVYFGDGVLGKALENGNVIIIEYLVTDGSDSNTASIFTLDDTINGNSNAIVTTVSRAVGGSDREDIESIKFNAPLAFVAQNRAITPDDYKAIILNNYGNIDAISVWGGEDQVPPDYGKVYISIKPKDGETLPFEEKEFIKAQYLRPKNLISIEPIIVDPTFTYIFCEVFYKYNPNITDYSVTALSNIVRESIRNFNDNSLKRFDGVFRYSNFLRQLEDADPSIINTFARVYMEKRIVPNLTKNSSYEIRFSSAILSSNTEDRVCISSEFVYNNVLARFEDRLINNRRVMQIITGEGSEQRVLSQDEGYIDTVNGVIYLSSFRPQQVVGSEYISFQALPNSNDIAPLRNDILSILVDNTSITGEADTMLIGGTNAGVDYNTFSRFR